MLRDKALALQFVKEWKALFDKYQASFPKDGELTVHGIFGTIDDVDVAIGTIWSEQSGGWVQIHE